MQSLRYMTMVDATIKEFAKKHIRLSDPELRMEISQAVAHAYIPVRSDSENREALSKAVEEEIAKVAANLNDVPSAPENLGEIYVFNIVWIERGAVFSTDVHYVSFGDSQDTANIEEFLANNADNDSAVLDGVTWVSIINNVPLEVLPDDAIIRFIGHQNGGIAEIGSAGVADMRSLMSS